MKFEIFGEMDSAEEINKTAEGLLSEGDIDNLKVLAKENGIEEEDVEAYMDKETDELCDTVSAAYGKIDVEISQVDIKDKKMALTYIAAMTRSMCMDVRIAVAVRKKGKSLEEIYNTMREESRQRGGVSCGTDKQLCDIICTYYLDDIDKTKEKIKSLYE